jgi:hypothetical protein
VHAPLSDELAIQLSLLINGQFFSAQMFSVGEARGVLLAATRAMIAAVLSPKVMQ